MCDSYVIIILYLELLIITIATYMTHDIFVILFLHIIHF